MPKVSYLIALYNKEKFILDAIQSVLDDCSEEYEIEICIVDDGSKDNSLDLVIKNYSDNKKIKIEKFRENRGKNAAYNAAFNISTGDFISLLGADDKIIKGRTKILIDECKKSGKSVYGGLIKKIESSRKSTFHSAPKKVNHYRNIIGNTLPGGCALIHRKHAENIFPIPEDLRFEDWWVSFHLLKLDLAKTVEEPVLIYNIHNGNDCGTATESYESIKANYERHIEYLKKLEQHTTQKKEKIYLERSLSIRENFLARRTMKTLASRPFDISWAYLATIFLLGPRKTASLKIKASLIISSLKKIIRKN